MPWITNISMADAVKGNHPEVKDGNAVLIQIQDFGTWTFAKPKFEKDFASIHQYCFDDIDELTVSAINPTQAADIAQVLKHGLDSGKNVVVHCHAGVCRSGAVTEVGVMLGFEDASSGNRIPNTRVKKLLRHALGLVNSWEV